MGNLRQNDLDAKAKFFTAKVLTPGLVRYGDDLVLLTGEAIARMAESFLGRPVLIEHDNDITKDNFAEKAEGYVIDMYPDNNDLDGAWYVKFTLHSEDAIRAYEEEGYNFVSCAYRQTAGSAGGVYHNIPYKETVEDGFFEHLALTKTPRYEEARIFANALGKDETNNDKQEESMFSFLKRDNSMSLDENSLIETPMGAVKLGDLVEAYRKNSIEEEEKENKKNSETEEEKENSDEEEKKEASCKKNEEDEKENSESEEEKQNSEEEQKENSEDEEKKENKKNSESEETKENSVNYFKILENAKNTEVDAELKCNSISLSQDNYARGKSRYSK